MTDYEFLLRLAVSIREVFQSLSLARTKAYAQRTLIPADSLIALVEGNAA